jgi:SanA protein
MIKKTLKIFLWLIVSIFTINFFVVRSTKPFLYSSTETLPTNKVGLVFGTAKTHNGLPNIFFTTRINAAVEAYNAQKIEKILVSGDNGTTQYNEPQDMKEALMEQGVAEADIILDYAGFSTLDSVIRAKEVFGQSSYTIVSQKFQNERAIFIGRHHDIDMVGYNTAEIPFRVAPRVYIREYAARVKLLLDIYILRREPKFLGDKIEI